MRLARHLRASTPQVPITHLLLSQLNELVDDLRYGNAVSSDYGFWDEIFEAMVGDECDPPRPTCGAPLLHFAGHLSDTLREYP